MASLESALKLLGDLVSLLRGSMKKIEDETWVLT